MSDPLVIHVLETKFGLAAFSEKKLNSSISDLRESLQACIESPRQINWFMIWIDTKQGHEFWMNYNDREEPYLSEGRKILKEALQMASPTKNNTEYL